MEHKKSTSVAFLIVAVTLLCACTDNNQPGGNPPTTTKGEDEEITLIIEGYGYAGGDIVKIDRTSKPETGDVVYYSSEGNNDGCMAFGPDVRLARITGKAGDKVVFNVESFEINGETFAIKEGTSSRFIWGSEIFLETPSYELTVPAGEYMADKWLGFECTGETDETGSSIAYNRFTIKEGALLGIVKEKTGHDEDVEQMLKNIVY